MQIGTLSIVATPIGNLEDITLRALRVLGEADIILCEDTRTTGKLLAHHGIKAKKLASYNAHSTKGKSNFALDALQEGKNVALVSDAGTPGISDPGMLLVRQARDMFGSEAKIVAIPGASALISALSISGISAASFVFHGFIPHKKGRETLFNEIAKDTIHAHVAYESSHRVLKALQSLAKVLPEDRKVSVARELTKMHEEVLEGSAGELAEFLTKNPVKQKGEFVLIVSSL
jgi:16S rRNA (cytidine1402-2'-O)-methyltransferase